MHFLLLHLLHSRLAAHLGAELSGMEGAVCPVCVKASALHAGGFSRADWVACRRAWWRSSWKVSFRPAHSPWSRRPRRKPPACAIFSCRPPGEPVPGPQCGRRCQWVAALSSGHGAGVVCLLGCGRAPWQAGCPGTLSEVGDPVWGVISPPACWSVWT